jgi:hypothetical integral membrane protein (TIGR02206 family)
MLFISLSWRNKMEQFFAKDYSGGPFVLFGPAHLAALGVVALFILTFTLLSRKISPQTSKTLRVVMALILLTNEIAWHTWNIVIGTWTPQTMLPLHLCSVLVWTGVYMLLTGNYRVYEYAYLLGCAGALQALLTPDAGQYGFPHFRFFQTMLSHGLLLSIPLYMTVVEGMRPTWRSVVRVMTGANIYMIFVGLVNWLIGSNFLFIAHKPETASILDVLPPWPWYILIIELLGVSFALLFYAPFAIRDWKSKKVKVSA